MKLLNRHLVITIGLVLSLLIGGQPFALTGRAAQNPSRAANLVGEWQCSNEAPHAFVKFRITSQAPDGTFSGHFIQVDKWTVGTIGGRIQGDRIEFVRGFMWDGQQKQQRWSARLAGTGDNVQMVEGRWAGFNGRDDGGGYFSAEKIRATDFAWAQAPNLVGEWEWTCSSGRDSGKWRITTQQSDATFSGKYLNTNQHDIGTLDGRLSGNQVEFLRRWTLDSKEYVQHYSAHLEGNDDMLTMKGNWSGAFDNIGNTLDFSAVRIPSTSAALHESTVVATTETTDKQEQAAQVTETDIQVTRSKPGRVIGRYETPVKTGSRLQIQYFVSSGHCSSIRLRVYVDGNLVRTTSFLGWPYGEGPSFGPLDTGLLDLGPVSSGTHALGLEAEGREGGCNKGPESPWWSTGGWAGRLRVITSPERADAAIDISGGWAYLGSGKAEIQQAGNDVTIRTTWTPRQEPGPHCEVRATISGQKLTGAWHFLRTFSDIPGSADQKRTYSFLATISDDCNSITVAGSDDPYNTNWNKVVFTRAEPRKRDPKLIADSVTGFSKTQGQNGWYYGYYAGLPANSIFKLMTQFQDGRWYAADGIYWTALNDTWMHPNSPNTSGSRRPEEQWVVRRWLSSVSGNVNICGTLAKFDTRCGDGITGKIFLDGKQIYSQAVAAGDATGVNYSLNASVVPGSKVDFVIIPGADDGCDSTKFTARIGQPASAQNTDLFNNFNRSETTDGPLFQPTFTLGGPARISELVTYHWNDGRGAMPGTISLRDQNKKTYGPFAARGERGQDEAPNVNWVATVDLTLQAGTYIVFDSEPGTWSRNAQSSYRGFAIVRGQFLQPEPMPDTSPQLQTTTPPQTSPPRTSPSPCPATYPNCTCRGAGCTHPDLTAFGGNGPFGTSPQRSIHSKFDERQFYWVEYLSPSTPVTALQQQCSQMRPVAGRLVLLDDEPWYYYFSGSYARFGCAR